MTQLSHTHTQSTHALIAFANFRFGLLIPELSQEVKFQFVNSNRGIELWLNETHDLNALELQQITSTNSQNNLVLEGGPLAYSYKLYKIELHSAASSMASGFISSTQQNNSNKPSVGRDEDRVSELIRSGKRTEHLIDGRDFDAEIQLHFYNQQLLPNADQARRLAEDSSLDRSAEPNQFAALSIFIQKFPKSTTTRKSDNLTQVVDDLFTNIANKVPKEWESPIGIALSKSQIDSLISTTTEFVTYQGSLNRPPCSENVDWILLNRALRISSPVYERLFQAATGSGEQTATDLHQQQQAQQFLSDNVRPVKPRHNRLLRTSINIARSAMQQQEQLTDHQSSAACQEDMKHKDSKVSLWRSTICLGFVSIN